MKARVSKGRASARPVGSQLPRRFPNGRATVQETRAVPRSCRSVRGLAGGWCGTGTLPRDMVGSPTRWALGALESPSHHALLPRGYVRSAKTNACASKPHPRCRWSRRRDRWVEPPGWFGAVAVVPGRPITVRCARWNDGAPIPVKCGTDWMFCRPSARPWPRAVVNSLALFRDGARLPEGESCGAAACGVDVARDSG